ncbi:MAG: metallophosphoesterase [Anaerolineae bacterium]|nr:metallophosphoesterase [Anaerolineae bacterium]
MLPGASPSKAAISRRRFLRMLAGGALFSVLTPFYATRLEPGWLDLVRLTVTLPSLPPALASLTIAQLSDIHLGASVELELLRRAVALVNAAAPDLVVLTGDFVTGEARHSREVAVALAVLKSRYGSYAVLGNHDIWTDADFIAAQLEQVGITVLRDARTRLKIDGAPLWLLGIEDRGYTSISRWGGSGDFTTFRRRWQSAHVALRDLLSDIPLSEPRVLLVHNPDFTEMLPPARVDLALCGHTHGGQVRIPLLGALLVPSCFGQKFVGGLVRGTHTQVYVSRGVGMISPAVRFNCRPEVTVLRVEG